MTYIDILKNLIEIDSSMPTLAAIEWVQKYLADLGIKSSIIYNHKKDTASLVATIGNPQVPGIVFSGHLDVVPAGSDWKTPPFQLTQKEGFFYGRGTSDMKGAVAVALSLVPHMIQSGKTFHLAFTGDEETTCECITDILKQYDFKNVSGCIVMEATGCRIIIGHKTINAGSIEITGRAAHSSQPELGVNALSHAFVIHKIFYELAAKMQECDFQYKTPFAVAEITTCTAGTADNVIPEWAKMCYNVRCLNEEQQNNFVHSLHQAIAEYTAGVPGLKTRVTSFCDIPGFNLSEQHPFVQRLLTLTTLSAPPKVSYATEAGYFGQAGIPVVIWGPGDIAQAHQVDEFISAEQLQTYERQLLTLISTL